MIITEEQHSQLEKVVRPVIEWLGENCNPHTSIIVDTTNAELVEGIASVGTKVSRVDAEVKVNFADIHTINYLHKVTGLMSVLSKLIINQLKSRS